MTEDLSDPVDPFAHLHEEQFEQAYETPLLTSDDMIICAGRDIVSLDGDWSFVLDPFREGLRQHWFSYDAEPSRNWSAPRDYDGGDWQKVKVPGSWNLQKREWFHFEGSAWYARSVEIGPGNADERILLRIGAASGRCRVFLNGRFLGLHQGGYAPFFADLTNAAIPGANRLMIEVDNTRRSDSVPMHHFDWFNYGGLARGVAMLRVPACHIRDFRIFLSQDRASICCRITLSKAVDTSCRVNVEGLGEVSFEVRGGTGAFDWACSSEFWSPDRPRLYPVEVTCAGDRIRDRVGFRTISASGTRILLNGEPVALRGICVHEDDLETGQVTSEEDIRRRFAHIRELGGNAARLAHYPHHELTAQIADELGILLWEEIPVYWAIDFDNPKSLADARNQLRELICRDFNRASVVIWGIGNENADTEARLRFMRTLADTVRAEDETRLVAAACLINRETFRIEDRLADHLDVIGLNEYFGWYEPGYDDLMKLLTNSTPDRPVVVSETGADALAGNHGDPGLLFTEERQAEVLENQVRIAAHCDYIAGIFPWLLYDFRSLRRQTGWQRGWNRKGVIAEDKTTKKLGFQTLKNAYRRYFQTGGTGNGRG